jgi:aspartyl/asparaginyl beta-hydroxylase (cupin superfamily)
MLLDAAKFRFTALLETAYPILRRESDQVRREDYALWPAREAYTSAAWRVFPFFLRDYPPELDCDFEANQRRCPDSVAVLRAMPGIVTAALSWLDPGAHVMPHIDQEFPGVVRAHLGLRVPKGALMRVGTDYHEWQEGKVTLFDGQIEHETGNLSAEDRVVLLADFELDERERAVLALGREDARRLGLRASFSS